MIKLAYYHLKDFRKAFWKLIKFDELPSDLQYNYCPDAITHRLIRRVYKAISFKISIQSNQKIPAIDHSSIRIVNFYSDAITFPTIGVTPYCGTPSGFKLAMLQGILGLLILLITYGVPSNAKMNVIPSMTGLSRIMVNDRFNAPITLI